MEVVEIYTPFWSKLKTERNRNIMYESNLKFQSCNILKTLS